MHLTQNIVERLKSDLNLRLDLAKELQVTEQAIKSNYERNNKNNLLLNYNSVVFLAKQLEIQPTQVFVNQKETFLQTA